jgi:hypothetical protein
MATGSFLLFALPLLTVPATPSKLETALEAVSIESICADVEFIACDELQGRDSPSHGLRVAARYIRSRLVALGLQPGARDGYFHSYELPMERLDGAETCVTMERGDWRARLDFGRDYFFSPFGFSASDVEGEVVYCGEGTEEIFDSEQVASEIKDCWAFCLDLGGEREDIYRVMMNARKAGAAGVLFTPGPGYAGEPYEVQFAPWTRSAREGSLRGSPSGSPSFPVLRLTSESGARLLGMGLQEGGSSLGGAVPGQRLGVRLRDVRSFARVNAELENVCGFYPGSDPELADEVVILSAHYDHVGVGVDKSGNEDVFNGADDNGSGTSALLAVAEALTSYGPTRRSVLLLWVSAEEKGLLGSRAWTQDPWLPEGAKAVANINVDMVGRNAPSKLLITPSRNRKEYNGLVRLAERLGPLEGFPLLGDPVEGECDSYWTRSDHVNFYRNLQIPVAFIFSDVHEDYHQMSDTSDKIDCEKIARVSRLLFRMVDGLQTDVLDL